MKHIDYLCFVCLIVSVSGCATDRQIILDAAVGPARPIVQNSPPEGRLVVYSGLDVANGGDDSTPLHSDYNLLSHDGQLLKSVVNRDRGNSEDPATVRLPPGKYIVVARASSFSKVTVPVIIEAWKITAVHLDGSELTGRRQTSTNDFVRLPDGSIIGWRAPDEAKPK